MEMFDVVDEKGMPTGKTVERSVAHAKGIRHRTAHIWIVEKKPQGYNVLLQKRSLNKDSFPGKYDTSSAGHVKAGDEPRDSALRELHEELGIVASPVDLHFVAPFKIQFEEVFHGRLFKDNEIAFVYVYEKPVIIENLVLQKEEVAGVKWFDLDELLAALNHHDPRFCVAPGGIQLVEKYLHNK